MNKPKQDDLDETNLLYDEPLDVDRLLDSTSNGAGQRQRAAWQRVEECNDVRRLREQLEDWDDWELTDSH